MMAKNSLCFAWAFEFMLKGHKSTVCSMLNLFGYMITINCGLYFLFISRDWRPLLMTLFYISLTGYVLVTLICPESPKWLLFNGRSAEAIKSLNYIAWFNRSPNRIAEDTIFVEAAISGNLEVNATKNLGRSFTQHLSQLSRRATQVLDARRAPKKNSLYCLLLYFCIMMPAIQIQYFCMYFLASSIDSNKFINLSLAGTGEFIGCIISIILLTRMHDHHVFQFFAVLAAISNVLFYLMPAGIFQFIFFTTFVMGLAGQNNSIIILTELRIPPENSGAAITIMTTLGTLTGSFSPYIVGSGFPVSMIVPSALACCNFILAWQLGQPEDVLPKAVKLSNNVTLVKVEDVSQIVPDAIHN